MPELRDQDFQVGDEVVFLNADHPNETFTICQNQDAGLYPLVASNDTFGYLPVTRDGRVSIYSNWQLVYHRDAIVFDACGNVHSVNEKFIKLRKPKIMTKELHEFKPFEKVLVCDGLDKWRPAFFSHISESKYPFECIADDCSYLLCVPFEGNEHLLSKETQ